MADEQQTDTTQTTDTTDTTETTDTQQTTVDPNEFARLQADNERLSQRAALLDQFEANPEATLRDAAKRLGMQLVPTQSDNATQDQSSVSEPPQSFVDSISRNLDPAMQFMAPALAKATWAANQEAQKPFREAQQQRDTEARNAERNQIAAEMDAAHPNWRNSLGEMEERFTFIQQAVNGGPMRHPKFGTLQEMLFSLATGSKSATTEAASRMREAAQNATSTSGSETTSRVDVTKQIGEAKSAQEKFDIAFKAALAEHGGSI